MSKLSRSNTPNTMYFQYPYEQIVINKVKTIFFPILSKMYSFRARSGLELGMNYDVIFLLEFRKSRQIYFFESL